MFLQRIIFILFLFIKSLKKKIIEILPFVENNLILNNDSTQTLNEKTIKIGFLGRLGEEKGLKDLIKASEIMTSKNIHHSIKIAGDLKDKRFKKHIDDLLQLQINNNCVNFIGKLDKDKKSDFFNSIDVLVLPSINSFEAFGLVQLEAMSLGKPVIASNLRGVRIPIKYTGNGLLYQKGNVNDLVKCIVSFQEWIKNIDKTDIIKAYNKNFNKEKFSNKYLSLFN